MVLISVPGFKHAAQESIGTTHYHLRGHFYMSLKPSDLNLEVQTLSSNPELLLTAAGDVYLVPGRLEGT